MARTSAQNNGKDSIISYLKKHPGTEIKRETLMKKTGISKSRLSELLKSLKEDDGYNIVIVKRKGILRYEPESKREQILPPVKDADIRQWMIFFFLSQNARLTFNQLLVKLLSMKKLVDPEATDSPLLLDKDKKVYDNSKLIKALLKNLNDVYSESQAEEILKAISITSLRRNLNELCALRIVERDSSASFAEKTEYFLNKSAPRLLRYSADDLFLFCEDYEKQTSAMVDTSVLENLYLRIKDQIIYDDSTIFHRSIGKRNDLDSVQQEAYNRFISSSYQKRLLDLETRRNGEERHTKFEAGLLYYSVETGCFYVLGRNLSITPPGPPESGEAKPEEMNPRESDPYKIDSVNFDAMEARRLDRIVNIRPLDEANTSYGSDEYVKAYNEIFSTGYTKELYKVKVLYSKQNSVKRRFDRLKETRSTTASTRAIPCPPPGCEFEYVYEDSIRGLEDFARYLRSFGRSVLAVEPPELVERMKSTYMRVKENYE